MGISAARQLDVEADLVSGPASTVRDDRSAVAEPPDDAVLGGATIDGAPVVQHRGGGVVARNLVGLLVSQVATWMLTLVSLIIVPRRLGAASFGQLQFATAFVAFFTLVGMLGTHTFIVKSVARNPGTIGAYVFNAAAMKLALTAALSAMAVLLSMALGYDGDRVVLVAVMCITMAFTVVNDTVIAGLYGLSRMARPAAWAVVGHYLGIGLGLVVVFTSRSLVAYALALGVGALVPLVANASTVLPYVRHHASIDFGLWKTVVRGGLPFFIWASFLLIYGTIDIPLLEALTDDVTVGWYTMAYRWVSTPVFIASIVLTAFLPSLSTEAHNDPGAFAARVNGALRVVVMVAGPLAVGGALVAGDAINLLYHADFERAVPVLQILAIHIPFAAMDMVLGMALIASDRQKKWVIVGGLAALTNPLLNLVAIPYAVRTFENGALGAAAITVVTELLMMGGALYLRPPGVMNGATARFVLRCALASGLMIPCVLLFRNAGLPVELAVGVIAYALASLALRTISIAEIRANVPRLLAALPGRAQSPQSSPE